MQTIASIDSATMRPLAFLAAITVSLSTLAALFLSLSTLFGGQVAYSASEPSVPMITPSATATLPLGCNPAWNVVSSPNPNRSIFRSVAARSRDDAWAVGTQNTSIDGQSPLIARWDGVQWNTVPNPGANWSYLVGVDVVSANEAWAVGATSYGNATMTMRWDGAQWSIIPSPNMGTRGGLNSVDAILGDDVWAVGYYTENNLNRALILHWNGTQWSIVTPGSVPTNRNYSFSSVSARSSNDVWAVGTMDNPTGSRQIPLVQHWNGTNWSTFTCCSVPGAEYLYLNSVTAISATDAWAVGYYLDASLVRRNLIVHWNGAEWAVVPAPNPGAYQNMLSGVHGLAPDDVWAVGEARQTNGGPYDTLSMHWNGTQWTVVPSPNGGESGSLTSVRAVDSDYVWTVGWTSLSDTYYTLGERYSTYCVTPSPTVTGTPPTSTRTRTNTPTPTPFPTATPNCLPSFTVVSSPNRGTGHNQLFDISALSASNIWAVGEDGSGQPLAIRWDGTQWSVVSTPPSPGVQGYFNKVSARAPDDVWAVGTSYYSSSPAQALIMHWNGSAWSLVPAPACTSLNGCQLNDVAALAADNAWAVGDWTQADSQTLILHWNGSQWSSIPSPNVGSGANSLKAATAISEDNVWVAGVYWNDTLGAVQPMFLHWNGTEWSAMAAPAASTFDNRLWGIDAASANDIWAVGYYCVASCEDVPSRTLALHWDGSQWSVAPTPVLDQFASGLWSVSALAADDAWAVGFASNFNTHAIHWNGSAWSAVNTQDPGTSDNRLRGVVAVGSTDVWAVGARSDIGNPARTLVEHYGDPCTTPTSMPSTSPTSTSTRTPTFTSTSTGTATFTSTPNPTQNTTATPTSCPVMFSDVPVENAFYTWIRCLACRGIVSGYGDGTFRPFGDITRGQIAKIVSNAAGFEEDPGAQIYDDVDPGNPFYTWINRLSMRGHMGGYPCGNVAQEPCNLPDNRPYFRPFANATRGQLSKIVANAAGLDGTPLGIFYTDVGADNPFYLWIMRLTELGVMSGYPCGGEGEPCDEEDRPYFRLFSNVTRGQAAKIVANTFLPGCETP
jgi:hypothetical protein